MSSVDTFVTAAEEMSPDDDYSKFKGALPDHVPHSPTSKPASPARNIIALPTTQNHDLEDNLTNTSVTVIQRAPKNLQPRRKPDNDRPHLGIETNADIMPHSSFTERQTSSSEKSTATEIPTNFRADYCEQDTGAAIEPPVRPTRLPEDLLETGKGRQLDEDVIEANTSAIDLSKSKAQTSPLHAEDKLPAEEEIGSGSSPFVDTQISGTLDQQNPSVLDVYARYQNPLLYPSFIYAPSSFSQVRSAREGFDAMTPIHEEEFADRVSSDQQHPYNNSPHFRTSVPESGPCFSAQTRVTTSSLPQGYNPNKPSASNSAQFPTSSTSDQAAERIAARIQASVSQSSLGNDQSQPGQMVAKLLSGPVIFSYIEPHKITNCWLSSCGDPTSSTDGQTVICPRCGDHSFVRYCSIAHLLSDMKDHYINHCGRRQNLLIVDENTMTPLRASFRPFVRVGEQNHDSIERHRQALYHAYPPELQANTTRPPSDYYLFSDADRFDAAGLPMTPANLATFRGTGSIAGRVRFNASDPRKPLFAELLERLLALGISAGTEKPRGCRLLFVWIKENLVGQHEWTEIMITRTCLAMQLEFGWNVELGLRD